MNQPDQLVRGQKYQYEHIAVAKELVYYHELYNELRVMSITTGMIWANDKKVYVAHTFLTDTISDSNWVLIGEL